MSKRHSTGSGKPDLQPASPDLSRRQFIGGSAAAAMLAAVAPGLASCSRSDGLADAGTRSLRTPGSLPDSTRAAGAVDETLPFDHIVVVMMENHSFDNYFGMLPLRGQPLADGFSFDANGKPTNSNPLNGGRQKAFRMPGTCQPNSVTQNWNSSHKQINGGDMNGFAGTSTTAMGYWDEPDLPFYYSFAKTFCLGNRCFASAPAQTYPNRRFLYSATAQGTISTDFSGFAMPGPANGTLMDLLSKYGVSWKSYFTDLPALVIVPQNLEKHPLNFAPVAEFFVDAALGTLPAVSFVDPEFGLVDEVGGRLFDYLDKIPNPPAFVADLLAKLKIAVNAQSGSEENPADIALGEFFVSQVVNAVMSSPKWGRTLLVWTYDEHGGYYDHVPPALVPVPDDIPPGLSDGDIPGTYNITGMRVPTVVASPYSKPNAVTNVVHDHTSIIATIAQKWNLPALTWRDAQATTLLDFLDLENPPAFMDPPKLAAPALPTLGVLNCVSAAPDPVIE